MQNEIAALRASFDRMREKLQDTEDELSRERGYAEGIHTHIQYVCITIHVRKKYMRRMSCWGLGGDRENMQKVFRHIYMHTYIHM